MGWEITEHRLGVFIAALEKSGSVRDAARVSGMDTSHLYKRRQAEPEFAARWHTALENFAGRLHATLTDAAFGQGIFTKPDVRALIRMNEAHNSDVFAPKTILVQPQQFTFTMSPAPAQRPDALDAVYHELPAETKV